MKKSSKPKTTPKKSSNKITSYFTKQSSTNQDILEDLTNHKRKVEFNSPERKKLKISPEKRKSPSKLFLKSPNINEFKVEVLEKFVKVTPSKSQSDILERLTPVKSVEKKQQLILNYASPGMSHRSSDAQNANERTPVNTYDSSPRIRTPASNKVKMRLDFGAVSLEPKVEPKMSPKKIKSPEKDVDEFFEDSWDESFHFEGSMSLDLTTSQHCKVLEITKAANRQTIIVQSTKFEDKASCVLTDFWANMQLEVGCIVHLTAVKDDSSLLSWIVDRSNGLLVYEPDFLFSSTSIVGGLFCKRKSVLKDMYGGFDPQNKIMLVGTMVHNILQTCLRDNIQTPLKIKQMLHKLMNSKQMIHQLFESGLTKDEVESDVSGFIHRIVTFMQQYMSSNSGKYPAQINRGDWTGKIDAIRDIEENIWCPELGIKGKVDVSVKVGNAVMPLELKTGRASMSLEHRGQIVLYIMMMKKLGYNVSSGLLLYLREGVLRDIPMNEREQRDLTLLRNELVYYLRRRPQIVDSDDGKQLIAAELPPPINHHSACGNCEYRTLCCVYLQNDRFDLNGFKLLKSIKDDCIGHLEKAHIDYFIHFSSLLAIENNSMKGKPVSDIYTKSPETREKQGRCIINVRIDGSVQESGGLYATTFAASAGGNGSNFLASGIGDMNYVVVSTDKRPAVAAGLVMRIDLTTICIDLDRDLTNKKLGDKFHLDTYDSTSINTYNFTCLSLLMEDTPRAAELRKLIIDKAKPAFRKSLSAEVGRKAVPLLKHMNKMQQKAVIKALAANEYLLIKGMPGTGKTAMLIALVKFLVEMRQTVLITSHTHSAVDNVCLRLKDCGVEFLRLGSDSRIHPKIVSRSETTLTKDCKTPEELEHVYNSAKVIAVTCIGSKHPIFSKRTLDVCIVDESTQVLQCSVFRALCASKKFILIGDPDQLPPIVKNTEAQARGLSESLFQRLQCPESMVTLTYNYRMNKPITALANSLTYNGQLLIANEGVANATLRLPKLESMLSSYKDKQWLLDALNSDLKKAVCILDTGPVWDKACVASWIKKPSFVAVGKPEDDPTACTNPHETAIAAALVKVLLKGGLCPSQIGVMSPYRAQVAQISQVLQGSNVDINTVDQFQGQDKEVVIYSCTKSRDTSKPRKTSKFEILEDQRRLTVAITRGKHKLIIIADVATMKNYSPFAVLFNQTSPNNFRKLQDFNWEEIIKECEHGKEEE